jgi:hypothetical protein
VDIDEIKFLTPEEERQQDLAELVADQGADWMEHFKPGSFGCHELLDRTSVLADLVITRVRSHPACIQDPEWYALADQAADALSKLYQSVGAKHISEKAP